MDTYLGIPLESFYIYSGTPSIRFGTLSEPPSIYSEPSWTPLTYILEPPHGYFLSIIPRHFHITPLPTNIILICYFRIFALEYCTKSAHITIGDAWKCFLDVLSSFFFCRNFNFWWSHN